MAIEAKTNQANGSAFLKIISEYPLNKETKTFVKGLRREYPDVKSDKKVGFLLEKSKEMLQKLDGLDQARTRKIMLELIQLYNNRVVKIPLADNNKVFDEKSVEIINVITALEAISMTEKAGIVKILIGFLNETHEISPEFRVKRLGNGQDARFIRME